MERLVIEGRTREIQKLTFNCKAYALKYCSKISSES